MSLPDLSHKWKHDPERAHWWNCPECLLGSRVPYDALCPDRVQAWGDEREAKGLAQGREALLRARARMLDRAEAHARRASSTTSRHFYQAEQARKDADLLTNALTTMEPPDAD